MKITLRHFGKIHENGNIIFYDNKMWENQRLSLRGKEFELVIKPKLKRPSPNQFSYYFGGILGTCITCEQFSHYSTVEEIHNEVFKPMYLSYQVMVKVGDKKWQKTVTRSLSELNKEETSEFIQNVLNFCAQEGIEILEADKYVQKHYRKIEIKE